MESSRKHKSPFNTPTEAGLRALVLLHTAAPTPLDLQRLVCYDYFLVHSGDVTNGPASLHPATPYRSGELLVRRARVQHGLRLMIHKELVRPVFDKSGIAYTSTDLAGIFLSNLETVYANHLQISARWVTGTFRLYPPKELQGFVTQNMGRWGGEFMWERMHEEVIDE